MYNRGCEAIVRSTMSLLKQQELKSTYRLWSYDAKADAIAMQNDPIQVSDATDEDPSPLPMLRGLNRRGRLGQAVATLLRKTIPGMPDCVLSIGGDNFTLDYNALNWFVSMGVRVFPTGIPFVIWGASIGPFTEQPKVENRMRSFLKQVSLITVRESVSAEYLTSLGIGDNVVRVWDPAFALEPRAYNGPETEFLKTGDTVGFNISGLVAKWYPQQNMDAMLNEAQAFVEKVIGDGMQVLLIPHVYRVNGDIGENDVAILEILKNKITKYPNRVVLLPGQLTARELKWCIAQCRFFIGARTHATIAAISSGVPTIALAYSQKARGIWRDVFGHEDYLLLIKQFSRQTLEEKYRLMLRNESEIRHDLANKRPLMIRNAEKNAEALGFLLQ